jgi:FkbM family methyltransferase
VCLGYPAYCLDDNIHTDKEKENIIVVITIGKTRLHNEIYKSLNQHGYRNIILASEIIEYHLHNTPEEYLKSPLDYFITHEQDIIKCLALLEDKKSYHVFMSFLQTYRERKITKFQNDPIEQQYLPTDIKLNKKYSSVINCGSSDGDTVKQINKFYGKMEALACFEPDKQNLKKLTQYLVEQSDNISTNISAFPCGVFNDEIQLSYSSTIQCVALDHVLPNFRPTFINMDIEGAEPEALKGAENLIRENRPDLAICVYHAPNHIWDIPMYLDGLNLGYKFYLRNYTGFTNETVLYANVE